MVLEKNNAVASNFQVLGGYYYTGNHIKLVANLAVDKKRLLGSTVKVEVTQPSIGFGTFASNATIRIPRQIIQQEKDVVLSRADKKLQTLASKKMTLPTKVSTITLNDKGENGDEIPGDGRYSGIFKQTQYDGVYSFRFIAGNQKLRREKLISVHMKSGISPVKTELAVLNRRYIAANKQTTLKVQVTPMDKFGNKIGFGYADQLDFGIKQSEVVSVKDKLDGSYEVELKVQGKYQAKPQLKPMKRRLQVKQRQR